MRDVVLYSLISLDGVAEEPGDWMFEVDDDVFANLARVIASQDDVVLGRGTHDYWVDVWPGSDMQPFAGFINDTRKHVASATPLPGTWDACTVMDVDPAVYVSRLRQRPGGDIGIHGSLTLAGYLLAAGLVDRLELVTVPTVAGSGRRLWGDQQHLARFTLVGLERSATGAVFSSYERRS